MQMTVDLAPIERADLPQLLAWRNDFRLIAWWPRSEFCNEIEHASWFESQARDPTVRTYKVIMKAGGNTSAVGACSLSEIDFLHSRARVDLFIQPAWQRRGMGRATISTLLLHAFANLGLSLVWGEVIEGNPAVKMIEAVGMTKEGTRRAFYFKDGRRVGADLYSITRDEWHDLLTGRLRDTGGEHHSNDSAVASVERIQTRKSKSSKPDPDPAAA